MLAGSSVLLLGLSSSATPQTLAGQAFRIEYDGSGIRSLARTNDVHDTNYIAANGRLGHLVIRCRSTPQGDWREVREMVGVDRSADGRTISYIVGTRLPTLAARSTASAQVGAGSLRALNDGRVPAQPAAGRGAQGSAVPPAGGRGAVEQIPIFTWQGARGETQWVQLTFPDAEEVSSAQVHWVSGQQAGATLTLPESWRLLYRDGKAWKEVQATAPFGTEANAFTTIAFAPVRTAAMRIEVRLARDATAGVADWRIGPERIAAPLADLEVKESFTLAGEALDWTITLANAGNRPIEVGDLAVPFAFAERTPPRTEIYTHKLLRHSLVAGHGSWIYWQRAGGEGPYLVMTPMESTKFEYFDNSGDGGAFTPYIHAKVAHAATLAARGTWRLPTSALRLARAGSPGSRVTYSFRFRWARDVAAVRDVLFEEHKFDTVIVPGMAIPVDLPAMISLHTKNTIDRIQAEHPSATSVELLGRRGEGANVYRIRFSRLGENMLTVRYGNGLWASLEFFVTEPLETVIKKRAAFLVHRHQHKDPGKWYYGVYGDWDQKNQILRGPEDRDGLSTWLTDASDDAGNARPAYIASKNVFFPRREEIESLEIYVSRYVWGGMQMTDKEKYPFGIYGIPNFKVNRESADEGRNGQAHLWRIYDYPHIIMLYYRMYQIARFYPDLVTYLDAPQYLERAYRTAVAYWTVPNQIERWSADEVGTMNEAFIPELIDTLEEAGKQEWAATLRRFWEGKVDRFVNRTPNLYGSEFAFDSTGFESTGAFAKYAMARVLKPGEAPPPGLPENDFRRRVGYEAALKFLNFQLLLNMIDRGWLETTYYQLGSDYRGSLSYLLSYMSQMGGWSILDFGLRGAKDPTDYLRLGYASSLSSWALVNSGTAESGYGYWYPALENDGATGGGFVPEAMGRGWIGKQMPRGAWHYSAEEDVGYCGALRTHATIVAVDPIFGEIAYGGLLTRRGRSVEVIPRDGVRVPFHVVRGTERFHMTLDHDGYAKERPIVVDDGLGGIRFTVENRTGRAHETLLTVAGLPAGQYRVSVGGRQIATLRGGATEEKVSLPIGAAPTAEVSLTHR
jgi:hypothetical protein